MKKYFILLVFSLLTPTLYSQTDDDVDILTHEICRTMNGLQGGDTIRVRMAYERHVPTFLEKHKPKESQLEELWHKIFIRLQKNCNEFQKILLRSESEKSDWEILNQKPVRTISDDVCRNFINHKNLSYREGSGSKTVVRCEDGYWIETFPDGTYSKLHFRWLNDCEFELEFIESNNYLRKDLSRAGDRYRYGIFEKSSKGLHIWVHEVISDSYHTFWLYN